MSIIIHIHHAIMRFQFQRNATCRVTQSFTGTCEAQKRKTSVLLPLTAISYYSQSFAFPENLETWSH